MPMSNSRLKTCVVLCGWLITLYTSPLGAEERIRTMQEQPEGTIAIEMAGDKVSGTLHQAPLKSVLDTLSQLGEFTYRLTEPYAAYTVSRQFHQLTLMDTMKSLLHPFNYILHTTETGQIKEVRIFGLQHKAAGMVAQEFPAFRPSGKALPLNIATQPLPAFTPVRNTTGPVSGAQEHSKPLPPFDPVMNDTGPSPETGINTKPLPSFFVPFPQGVNKP